MSKIITTTFLLKNPAIVRDMINQGLTVLVKHNGSIAMQITLPNPKNNSIKPPTITPKIKSTQAKTYSRKAIYDGEYDQ